MTRQFVAGDRTTLRLLEEPEDWRPAEQHWPPGPACGAGSKPCKDPAHQRTVWLTAAMEAERTVEVALTWDLMNHLVVIYERLGSVLGVNVDIAASAGADGALDFEVRVADDTRPNFSPLCGRCGGRTVPVIYGYPDHSLVESQERGEVWLGGCLVDDGAAARHCYTCQPPPPSADISSAWTLPPAQGPRERPGEAR